MKAASLGVYALVAAGAAGCAADADVEPVPTATHAEAELRDPGGRILARSTATQVGDGVRVRIEAAGLTAGAYGVHIHAVGVCQPPAFESAGPHWNPTGRRHGSQNPQGQHLGDLPNLMVGTNGAGSLEYSIPGAALADGARPLLDRDGAALVVHARADDYRTDPSGNSGARLACGVFG